MGHLLILHSRLPGFVGRVLDEAYFAARLPAARRLTLNDPMHGFRTRYPEELEALPEEVRLISGVLPFGYLDGMRDRIMHVCVLADPEIAFLRFVAELGRMPPASVLRLTGESQAALPLQDPDALLHRLLELPTVRRLRLGAATRLCAGLPAVSDLPVDEAQLLAAQANLARVNCLSSVEPRLDQFAAYMADIFGWSAAQCGLTSALPRPIVPPEALGAAARQALRRATDIDRRLYDDRCEELDRRVA